MKKIDTHEVKQTYTYGKWEASHGKTTGMVCSRDRVIATVHHQAGEEYPNTKLIAAAPEMLEMLSYLMSDGQLGLPQEVREMIREVVIKAKGI